MWSLYKEYIDVNIEQPLNPTNIIESLTARNIAISDTIYSCVRHGFSSEDSKLIKRTYNAEMIREFIRNGVDKILCTSKGVLNDLETKVICNKKIGCGSLDLKRSKEFESSFIQDLGGKVSQIKSPISKVFKCYDKEVIAVAIPSPGSPQRKLATFGFDGDNWKEYSDNYFRNSFNWLISEK